MSCYKQTHVHDTVHTANTYTYVYATRKIFYITYILAHWTYLCTVYTKRWGQTPNRFRRRENWTDSANGRQIGTLAMRVILQPILLGMWTNKGTTDIQFVFARSELNRASSTFDSHIFSVCLPNELHIYHSFNHWNYGSHLQWPIHTLCRYSGNETKYQLCIFNLLGRRRNGVMLKFKRRTISFSECMCMCAFCIHFKCILLCIKRYTTSELFYSDSGGIIYSRAIRLFSEIYSSRLAC